MKLSLTERIQKNGFVICAEGYVFELERRGYVSAGPYVPAGVVMEFPDAVKELHREFVRAGSDVVLALTYYTNRSRLKDIGREADLETVNRRAVRLAREVAAETDALVAGNLCDTWSYDRANPAESDRIIRAMYSEQLAWAVDEGVDFVVAETLTHFREAEIALELIQEAKLPSVISLFAPAKDKTADGVDIVEACKRLSDRGATVVGLNCGRGPATMLPLLREIVPGVSGYVSALAVPYRTHAEQPTFVALKQAGKQFGFPAALEPFLLTRQEMADFAVAARELGVCYIGVCCGGAPYHVRAMSEALGRRPPASDIRRNLAEHRPMKPPHAKCGLGWAAESRVPPGSTRKNRSESGQRSEARAGRGSRSHG